jgi:DnaK suppressor protein
MTLSKTILTHQQIGEIRNQLERTLRKIERSLSTDGNGRTSDMDQSTVGRLSRIEALQNQRLTQSLRERERRQFDDIVEALSRMEDGSYGLCTRCRHPIGFERLLVFPETRNCTGCGTNH